MSEDIGGQLVGWSCDLPWTVAVDALRWEPTWAQTVERAQLELHQLARGRDVNDMRVEVQELWSVENWDEDARGRRSGLFGEQAVRVSVGPVIGPLPEPAVLHAHFSGWVAVQ